MVNSPSNRFTSESATLLSSEFMDQYASPVAIVGTVALDILHFWDQARTAQTGVRVEIGGVCKHVACVMGTLGSVPRFISARFPGELGGTIAGLFKANNVDWQPIDRYAPFSLFEAQIDSTDQVFAESFIEGESIAILTPDVLRQNLALSDAKVIVTCTNLTVPTLNELAAIAADQGSRFWLLTSSTLEAPRIAQIRQPIDLISLNVEELSNLVDQPLESIDQIAKAAQQITEIGGKCLITLGSRGALLYRHGADHLLRQPVEPIRGKSPVGGGDVLFSSLLVGLLRDQSWESAFAFAAACTRRYLLRDPDQPNPYRALTQIDPNESIPSLERIPLSDVR